MNSRLVLQIYIPRKKPTGYKSLSTILKSWVRLFMEVRCRDFVNPQEFNNPCFKNIRRDTICVRVYIYRDEYTYVVSV